MKHTQKYRDQIGYLLGSTDSGAQRFTTANDRLCDYSRPDENAGLHKHVIDRDHTGKQVSFWHCMACERDWEKR